MDNHKKYNNPDNCLSQEQLLGLINGNVSETEKSRLETHLAKCDLCSYALRGWEMVSDIGATAQSVDSLNSSFLSQKPSFYSDTLLKVAASLTLAIVAGGFLYYSVTSSEVSDHVLAEASTAFGDSMETEIEKKQEVSSEKKEPEQLAGKMVGENLKDPLEEKPEALMPELLYTEDFRDSPPPVPVAPHADMAIENEIEKIDHEDGQDLEVRTNKGNQRSSGQIEEEEDDNLPRPELFSMSRMPASNAIYLYNNSNFRAAEKAFAEELKEDPMDHSLNFYAGMNNFQLQKYEAAIAHFDRVLADEYSGYFFQAQWQKVKLLVEMGKSEVAIPILQDIIEAESIYMENARQLLKQVKD